MQNGSSIPNPNINFNHRRFRKFNNNRLNLKGKKFFFLSLPTNVFYVFSLTLKIKLRDSVFT